MLSPCIAVYSAGGFGDGASGQPRPLLVRCRPVHGQQAMGKNVTNPFPVVVAEPGSRSTTVATTASSMSAPPTAAGGPEVVPAG